MWLINGNKRIWKVFLLLTLFLPVYIYLYTRTSVFHDLKISTLNKAVEGTSIWAVWKDSFDSMMKQLDKKVHFEFVSKPTHSTTISPSKDSLTTAVVRSSTLQPMSGSELMNAYKLLLEKKESLPILTLFTSWSDNDNKYLMHNLTSVNWLSLRPYIIPVIFTNEGGLADECAKLGWKVFPLRVSAIGGVPVLKFMYLDAMAAINSTFYAYANSDILFTNGLVETLISIANIIDFQKPTLMVGKRTNVPNVTEGEGSSWENITQMAKERGELFIEYAEDYFITQGIYPWEDIPEVVIGRTVFDNFLVVNARKSNHHVIDITQTTLAVHQTTSAGNRESHGQKNKTYNEDLLQKLYKSVPYSVGGVHCINKKSVISNKGVISLRIVTVAKRCRV